MPTLHGKYYISSKQTKQTDTTSTGTSKYSFKSCWNCREVCIIFCRDFRYCLIELELKFFLCCSFGLFHSFSCWFEKKKYQKIIKFMSCFFIISNWGFWCNCTCDEPWWKNVRKTGFFLLRCYTQQAEVVKLFPKYAHTHRDASAKCECVWNFIISV